MTPFSPLQSIVLSLCSIHPIALLRHTTLISCFLNVQQGRIPSRGGSKRSGSKDGDASSKNSSSPVDSSQSQRESSQNPQSSSTPNLNINPGNSKTKTSGSTKGKMVDSARDSGGGTDGNGAQGSTGQSNFGAGLGGNGAIIGRGGTSPTTKLSGRLGSIGHGDIGVGGISNGGVMGSGTAVPASLGGRTTIESQPVHARSLGFNEGGISGITNIEEGK